MKTVEDILNSPNAKKIAWTLQIKMSPNIKYSKETMWYPALRNSVFNEQIDLNTEQCLRIYQAIKSVLKKNILDHIQRDHMTLRDLSGLQLYSTYNDCEDPIEFTPNEAEYLCAILNSVCKIEDKEQHQQLIEQKKPSFLSRIFKRQAV